MSVTIDDLVARTDTALAVVTTSSRDQRAGCLVGFHTQCSIEPFRYAIWLSKANYTYRVALFATHFAVHFLSDHDEQLAELFGTESGDSLDKFELCAWTAGAGAVPLLDGCAAVVFEKQTLWDDGGDHVCIVGSPVTFTSAEHPTPLRISAAGRFKAGHAAQERPIPQVSDPLASDVKEMQAIAAGFGHELAIEQITALQAEHESLQEHRAADTPNPPTEP
jgi:flavin reductase (DIM6/NTAB) family NADH-FMN oxidoreductase RutF